MHMKKIIGSLVLLLILAGCQTSSQKVTTLCSYKEGPWNIEQTFTSKDDVLLIEDTNQTYQWVGYMTEEEINEELVTLSELYSGIDGLTYTYDLNEEEVLETYYIDYTKATYEQLAGVGLLEENDHPDAFASLEATIENLEAFGYECK